MSQAGRRTETGGGASGGGGAGAGLVRRLVDSVMAEARTRHLGEAPMPSREAVAELVDLIRQVVFPGFFGPRGLTQAGLEDHLAALTHRIRAHAIEQIGSVLHYARHVPPGQMRAGPSEECRRDAERIAEAFLEGLPALREAIALDVQAAFDGDPAASHTDETIFCYPGVDAVFAHRVAHALHELGAPLLPRIIAEQAHSRTGIDIHPGARIGRSFFIDHGAGVVIGETTVIGDHVKMYQGVTLGAKSFPRDEGGRIIRGQKRHPTIGDRVTIYAGAVILGGDTVVGEDCVISGGVFITDSVPPRHVVRQKKPELVLRTNREAEGARRG